MASSYNTAKQIYADFGVDTEKAMEVLDKIPLSMHCWQGDDVGGFETPDATLGCGGIQATGNFPGKARSVDELRADIDEALKYIPGKTRINLHAIYGEFFGKKVDRDEISFDNFKGWTDWCKDRKMGIDFNPTFFSHPLAADGFTLSSADRLSPRERMAASLDEIFSVKISKKYARDAVESKLFGIGSESYVVGSHEFFMGYAVKNGLILTLDSGHFHPTETIADKISSMLMFVPELLLHVSRGVRWDSDHVVVSDDPTVAAMREVVRCGGLSRVHIGMDFFDASINRIFAWAIGMRAARKSLLLALLDPLAMLRSAENSGDYGRRLALVEESQNLPSGDVWAEYCKRAGVPCGIKMLDSVKKYERGVIMKRK